MKKRIWILCGVVALLAALSLLPAGATEPTTQDIDFSAGGTVSAVCPHCKGEAVNWLPLTQEVVDSWYTSGASTINYSTTNGTHYYVSEDIISFPKPVELTWDETLCLHLNGKEINRGSTGARAFSVTGKLNLMDHAANAGVVQAYAESTSTGCVIRVNEYSGATFRMYGGTVKMLTGSSSRASKGGCVYVATASPSGGNFYLYGGTITGGRAAQGGNVYVGAAAKFIMEGGTITGGFAEGGPGGNVYSTSGNVTISGGTITGGTAGTSGGNIFNTGSGSLVLSGGTFTDGVSANYGGNVYTECPMTLGGSTCLLGGSTGKMGNNMYVGLNGRLTVTADYTGEVSASFHANHLSTPIRGGKVSTSATCEGVFTGKLMIENDPQQPAAYAKAGDTTLYISAAAVVKNDGTKVWYNSNAEAVAAYSDDVKCLVVAPQGGLALSGGDYTVDLSGANVAVTGTGNVTFIDTANKDYATYGSATVDGVTVMNDTCTVVDGVNYIMIEEDGTYTFHCLGVKLAGINISTDSSGIYYTGQWGCDAKLAEKVKTFGVAVSLREMPTETFATTDHCMFTAFDGSELDGDYKNSAEISGILKAENTAARNNQRGRMPIYAQAYVTLTDDVTVVMGSNGAVESLNTSMMRLDNLIKNDIAYSRSFLGLARNFYNTWKEQGMGSWNLRTIPVQEKKEDGKLNLLMVGNSFCYYYVEELYALLMENLPEGIEEVNIYNVYHSGCTITEHYNRWVADEAYYTLFKMSAEGRETLTGEYAATLEEALRLEEDWDYISLQGTVSNGNYSGNPEFTAEQIAITAEPLLDRFHELFPNAQLLWNRTWALEVGRVSGSTTWTETYAQNYDNGMQIVCDYMCNEFDQEKPYDLVMVNSGKAWCSAREQNAELEESLLAFGGLCARLGISSYGENLADYTGPTANSGDGQHDGDIGGGQLLNAYVWYETLTGKDCSQTVYRPTYTYDGTDYTLSEDLVTILQNAAHEVVSGMPETVQPAS